MFTGIIETMGEVLALTKEQSNLHIRVASPITSELKIDQSVSHNGVCLTVVAIEGDSYTVTAIDETLKKTNLGDLKVADKVNLERCMPANGRFDGHIVQGHVDQVGECVELSDQGGSWIFRFKFSDSQHLVVEKGSICINGVSLTCFDCTDTMFSVAIIPYTFAHTNFHQLKVGSRVNLEFDIVGKYIQRMLKK
ncbi:riboflavin synthase [Cytophagales bacterium LB-30]|uniref:Riboflavin synthase n=1 Tax=Shiella aurantiaca TaxID=3058365 RepID=A0ABT8F7N4_9BACT|nr:riboflavin synthase [Shiella aurantiaca]MDN4166497.1 riboflavin synthase [Shiella aurantiaca]